MKCTPPSRLLHSQPHSPHLHVHVTFTPHYSRPRSQVHLVESWESPDSFPSTKGNTTRSVHACALIPGATARGGACAARSRGACPVAAVAQLLRCRSCPSCRSGPTSTSTLPLRPPPPPCPSALPLRRPRRRACFRLVGAVGRASRQRQVAGRALGAAYARRPWELRRVAQRAVGGGHTLGRRTRLERQGRRH
jgi:hypothetical protein